MPYLVESKVVANTTPLIALADIGQLELLHQLYGEIFIPTAVLNEIERLSQLCEGNE